MARCPFPGAYLAIPTAFIKPPWRRGSPRHSWGAARLWAARLWSARPVGERLGEGALAGRALADGDDGARAVREADRNFEARARSQRLRIALRVGLFGR